MNIIRLLALSTLLALSATAQAQNNCASDAGLDFVCGVNNPEDLVLVPGSTDIISSGMADGMSFFHIDSQALTIRPLSFNAKHNAALFPACNQPPSAATMNTHGLSIRELENGTSRLYVVSHGAREAVEVFDVSRGASGPALTWIGCVAMPEGLQGNSVASLADGTVLVTVLFMPGFTFADAVVDRIDTGAVFSWSPGDAGFEKIEGSELPANNGIEVSADGSRFYVASSGLQTIVAFSNTNPARQLGSTGPLPITPDNVHMAADGLLYTAGMANDVPECGGPPGPDHDLVRLAACPRNSIAVAIDPQSMQEREVMNTQISTKFSNATMVLPLGDYFWIGSFSSDRLARAPR